MGVSVDGRGRLDQAQIADSKVLACARDRSQVRRKKGPNDDNTETLRVHARNYQAGKVFMGER